MARNDTHVQEPGLVNDEGAVRLTETSRTRGNLNRENVCACMSITTKKGQGSIFHSRNLASTRLRRRDTSTARGRGVQRASRPEPFCADQRA